MGGEVQALERIIPIARQHLTIPVDEEQQDLWLWERAERVMQLTPLVARLPEVADRAIDRTALAAAALFHCAGWASQVQQGRVSRWQVLCRPTSDLQRELGAALLLERAGHLLPPKTARLAADALRQCNDRASSLLEAQLLAEAETLDDISVLFVLRQFRQYQAEGRPLRQLLATWDRQQEYQYWEVRINDGLRFESTRQVAGARLAAIEAFMQALARDLDSTDLRHLIEGRSGGADADPGRAAQPGETASA